VIETQGSAFAPGRTPSRQVDAPLGVSLKLRGGVQPERRQLGQSTRVASLPRIEVRGSFCLIVMMGGAIVSTAMCYQHFRTIFKKGYTRKKRIAEKISPT
jgi:hypothetical protein